MLRMRFQKYRLRMGFTAQLMAQFLNIRTEDGTGYSLNGYVMYERKNNSQPPFDTKLAVFAERMLVNLNWLAGFPGAEMWSPELLRKLRVAVRRYTDRYPASTDEKQRICDLIRFIHQFDTAKFDLLLLVGVCRHKDKDGKRTERKAERFQTMQLILNGQNAQLAGNSDRSWRERIGNGLPPAAMKAIGEMCLLSLLPGEEGEWILSPYGTPVWVRPNGDEVYLELSD